MVRPSDMLNIQETVLPPRMKSTHVFKGGNMALFVGEQLPDDITNRFLEEFTKTSGALDAVRESIFDKEKVKQYRRALPAETVSGRAQGQEAAEDSEEEGSGKKKKKPILKDDLVQKFKSKGLLPASWTTPMKCPKSFRSLAKKLDWGERQVVNACVLDTHWNLVREARK